jgi:hypothetical protein
MKLDSYLSPVRKPKWFRVKCKSQNYDITRRNNKGNILGSVLGNFFDMTLNAQAAKPKIDKWYCTTLRSFCTEKKIINILKRQHIEWEKIFVIYVYEKWLILKIYKKHLRKKKKNNQNKNELMI